jgi:hypothetical protein
MEIPKKISAIWNRLYVGTDALPGIVQRIRLGGALVMDSTSVSGKDGLVVANADWSEDTFTIELLIPETEIKNLFKIRTAYKNKPGIKPTPVTVGHPLLKEMGIQKAIFKAFVIDWDNTKKNTVPVTVEFTNITPKPEKSAGATNPDGTVKPTNPPTSSKPGQSGIPTSNAMVGQPTPTTLQVPTIPPAPRGNP